MARITKRSWIVPAVTLAAWVVVGWVLAPAVITRAYAGESIAFLNDLLAGRAAHPLETYIAAWERLRLGFSVVLVLLCTGFVLAVAYWPEMRAKLHALGETRRLSRREMILFLISVGVIAGVVEAAIAVARQWIVEDPTWVYSRDVIWMAPLANTLLWLVVAVVLLMMSLLVPSVASWPFVVFPVVAIALFSFIRIAGLGVHVVAAALLAAGAALLAARHAAGNPALWMRSAVRIALASLAVIVLATLGTRASERRARSTTALVATEDAPNVLLIILDTVRRHSLSVYGYERRTTPVLEEFAAQGVIFEHAITPSSWTLPSHASMFTGQLPHEFSGDWGIAFRSSAPPLAEELSALGYATGGFVANLWYTSSATGLDRGFQTYRDHPNSLGMMLRSSMIARRVLSWTGRDATNLARKDAARVNAEFLQWLDEQGSGSPWFAFLNYFDAHEPYESPDSFRIAFASSTESEGVDRPNETRALAVSRARYDAAIAYMDAQMGRLLEELRGRGTLDRTIVIITSDHGEQFGEKQTNLVAHGNSLYHSSLAVPLVVVHPRAVPAGRRIQAVVGTRSIAGTVLELVSGQRRPHSLVRLWADSVNDRQDEAILSELSPPPWGSSFHPTARGPLISLTQGTLHYVRSADGTEELYDIALDPWERNDLAAAEAMIDEMTAFRALLRQLRPVLFAGAGS